MRKSSRSISLALIGSAFLLGGCQPAAVEQPESEWGEDVAQVEPGGTIDGVATGNDQYNNGTHGSGGGMGRTASRIGGAMIGSQIGRSIGGGMSSQPSYGGGGGYGGGSAASPSARGGFGSSAGSSSAT